MRAGPCVLAIAILVAPRAALAQDPRAEARERFTRAVELYDEGRYEAALAEFQRAYDLAPAAPVLFNVAQVHAAMGHAVAAVAAYERYLAEGGDAISTSRRAEVEEALRTQRARIARLTIDASALGATITVDDVEVGTTPLAAPIPVDAGEHVIAARAPGHEGVRRRIRIAGSRDETIRLELLASDVARGAIRVTSPIPAIEILIDERPVGLTPFDGTIAVPAGPHRLRARREGYLPKEEDVIVDAGAEREVRFALERDPGAQEGSLGTLSLSVPDAEGTVTIDGEEQPLRARYELPVGPHDLVVRIASREPWRGRVEVAAAARTAVAPELRWTPEAIDARNAGADVQLGVGIALTIAGAIAVAAGAGIWVANQTWWSQLVAEYTEVNRICEEMPAQCLDAIPAGHPRNLELYNDHVNSQREWRTGTDVGAVITMALGSALAVAGVVLLATTPGHLDRDVRVSIGPGSLSVAGSF